MVRVGLADLAAAPGPGCAAGRPRAPGAGQPQCRRYCGSGGGAGNGSAHALGWAEDG